MRTKPVSLKGLTALEVAQLIINEFGPPGTVTAWRAVENQANVVELDLVDGSTIKLVGLFAHHILSADHKQRKAASIGCICGIDDDPTGKLPRLDIVCPKHDGIWTDNMVILQLTDEQAKNLQEILMFTQDEGPEGEGWASDELKELRQLLDQAMIDTFARERLQPTR